MAINAGMPNDSSNGADGPGGHPERRVGSSRAARLLEQLIRRQLVPPDALLKALAVSRQQLLMYLSGDTRMPLASQRRLAEFVVSHAPALAREAHRLRVQCDAEELFQAGDTRTHMVAPPSRFR